MNLKINQGKLASQDRVAQNFLAMYFQMLATSIFERNQQVSVCNTNNSPKKEAKLHFNYDLFDSTLKVNMNIEQMRNQYAKDGINRSEFDADPMIQFGKWFKEAVAGCEQDWMESNAMTLSTSDLQGQVTSRVVLLKGYDTNGFQFFTNYDSQKGKQMEANPHASLLFYWGHLERQVRVNGTVERTSRAVSEKYFQSRPRKSQLSAAVSAQSERIGSRAELEQAVSDLEESLDEKPVPTPENWGGYLLTPTYLEFWQGRMNRLHDRLAYMQKSEDGVWEIERIQP